MLTTNSQTSAGNQLMNGRKANPTKMRVKIALIQPSQRGSEPRRMLATATPAVTTPNPVHMRYAKLSMMA